MSDQEAGEVVIVVAGVALLAILAGVAYIAQCAKRNAGSARDATTGNGVEMDSQSSFRCSICGVNWPHDARFNPCPECGDETSGIKDPPSLDMAEALRRKNHADFERFYADREANRKREGEAIMATLERDYV